MTIEELSQLSDEELRVKVAEKMGWRLIEPKLPLGEYGFEVRNPSGETVYSDAERPYWPTHILPPFSTSLDAIHEAWLTLDAHGQDVFAGYLSEIFMGQRDFGNSRINCTTKILGATARQRAIAFLLV